MTQQHINLGTAPAGSDGDSNRTAMTKIEANFNELYAASAAINPIGGFKNKLINGNFDFWQRGTAFSAAGYTADRWVLGALSVSSPSAAQVTWGAGDPTAVLSDAKYLISLNNAGNTDAVNHQFYIGQKIEGVQTFAGKTVTLSFSAYSATARPIAIAFNQNYGSGGSATTSPATQTVNLVAGWASYSLQIAIPSIVGKTIGTAGDHLGLYIWLSAGTAFNTSTNNLGAQSGQVAFSGIQLEQGAVATPFEKRPLAAELALCQRYYEKSYQLSIAPGAAGDTNGTAACVIGGLASGSYSAQLQGNFKVTKRAAPTITLYSPASGAAGSIRNFSTSTDFSPASTQIGTNMVQINTGAMAAAAAINVQAHWAADAEL